MTKKKSKLTPADEKFVKEFLNGAQLDFSADTVIKRINRFSNEVAELCPVSAAALDFVMKVEPIMHNDAALKRIHSKLTPRNIVSKFDRARMIVMKLKPSAYMTLLD